MSDNKSDAVASEKPKVAKPEVKRPSQTKTNIGRNDKALRQPLAPPIGSKKPPTPPRNESIFSEAIFTCERVLKPVTREITFNVSGAGVIPVAKASYEEIKNDKKPVVKEFPLEAYLYYSTCHFWLRTLELKQKTIQDLTDVEESLLTKVEDHTFNLPQPLFLHLRALGKTVTKNGETLIPSFPPLPTVRQGNVPGTWGVVNADNHNFYEEYPAPGILVERILKSIADEVVPEYNPIVIPQGTTATTNLQGFSRLTHRRNEAKNFFLDNGISTERFPNFKNTGINVPLLVTISEYLANLSIFKIQKYQYGSGSEDGTAAQLISARPYLPDCDEHTRLEDIVVNMTSSQQETAMMAGAAETFLLQPYKESFNDPDKTPSQNAALWCCVLFPGGDNSIPDPWCQNRNALRNLPVRLKDRVFTAASDATDVYRKTVLANMRTSS